MSKPTPCHSPIPLGPLNLMFNQLLFLRISIKKAWSTFRETQREFLSYMRRIEQLALRNQKNSYAAKTLCLVLKTIHGSPIPSEGYSRSGSKAIHIDFRKPDSRGRTDYIYSIKAKPPDPPLALVLDFYRSTILIAIRCCLSDSFPDSKEACNWSMVRLESKE